MAEAPPTDDVERSADGTVELDGVRKALRRMGYLDRGMERFLLQDALRPVRPVRTLLQLSAKVGLLAGLPAALAVTLLLAALNGLLRDSPFDVVPLFLHLAPPAVLGLGLAFAALAGVLVLVLVLSHTRRIEAVSLAIAVVTALAALALVAWHSRPLLTGLGSVSLVALALAAAGSLVALVQVVQSGLLTLSIRLTDQAPERRTSRLVWRALAVAGVLLSLILPVLAVHRPGPRAPASLPMGPAERAVLIAVDGVRPAELDFLLAGGQLPALAARLARGGVLVPYRRPPVSPASFWTTVATGIGEPDHGMVSLDSFRPRGLDRALTRNGWLRRYWALLVPTGLVEYRPVLAHQRRAPAFWELAGHGGTPVLAINWWGTYPATPLSGLVVAHGGYQLLAADDAGAVAPEDRRDALHHLRATLPPQPIEAGLGAVLPAAERSAVLDKTVRADAFYLAAFRLAVDGARAAALYLPALDILPGLASPGSVAEGALARWQLRQVDALVADRLDGVDTVFVVLDPGRRGGEEGRALLWRRAGCRASDQPLEPAALAAGLLRALGLPQSAQLPPPPPMCTWPAPSLTIETFGERDAAARTLPGDEYLENLRSLGYL